MRDQKELSDQSRLSETFLFLIHFEFIFNRSTNFDRPLYFITVFIHHTHLRFPHLETFALQYWICVDEIVDVIYDGLYGFFGKCRVSKQNYT